MQPSPASPASPTEPLGAGGSLGRRRHRHVVWEVRVLLTVTAVVTLAVTAEEAGGYRWSSLELAGMMLELVAMPLGCRWCSPGCRWGSPDFAGLPLDADGAQLKR